VLAFGASTRPKAPVVAKKPVLATAGGPSLSLKRARANDASLPAGFPPLLRESQLCLVRKSAGGTFWPAVVLPFPPVSGLTDALPRDATYFVNLVDGLGTGGKDVSGGMTRASLALQRRDAELHTTVVIPPSPTVAVQVVSSRCWVLYHDVLPFDPNYKPQLDRLGARGGKTKPRPLVGWQAREASTQADFAAAMEMASMLASTQLQDGPWGSCCRPCCGLISYSCAFVTPCSDGLDAITSTIPVPTVPITLLGPPYAPVGVFKANDLFVCGNFVKASNRSQSVLEVVRIRCANVASHHMSEPCSSLDCCWLECRAYPILHSQDGILGGTAFVVLP
jgi:hypothetical protein